MARELLAAFVGYLRLERGLSEHTIRAYRGDVTDLFGYLNRSGGGEPEQVNLADLPLRQIAGLSLSQDGGRHKPQKCTVGFDCE